MLLSVNEIINKSLELFKRDFRVWLPYMALSFISALLSVLFAFNPTVLLFFNTLGVSSNIVLILSVMVMLFLAVFNVWLNLGLVRAIHDRLFNRSTTGFKEKLHETKHLLSRTIGISLLVTVMVILPLALGISGLAFLGFQNLVLGQFQGATALYFFFALLGVYGIVHLIYFSIRYAMSYYIVALEEKTVRTSLHESHLLIEGRFWSVFWRLFAPVLLFLLMYVLPNYIFVAAAKSIGGSLSLGMASILSLALSSGVAILIAIATVILYEDVKVKPVAPPVSSKKR